mgnify:CR=1 FL=1
MMKKNRIFIPFAHFNKIGGPGTFMRNLKVFLDGRGFSYLDTPEKARVIFFPVKYDLAVLKSIKKKKGKVIQRLDGIYYPAKHQNRYLELNKTIQKIYDDYADFVIFQSRYSKKQCFAMFGELKPEQYKVIVNGVDQKIFYPNRSATGNPKEPWRLITTGNFRNIDMLEPVVKALDQLREKMKLKFTLTVIGPVHNEALKRMLLRPYIYHINTASLNQIAQRLRNSHLFLYSHLNPPCPNSVLEAIASGLPVVGFKSGAMKELLFFAEDLLADVSSDLFQRYESFDPQKLLAKIVLAINNYQKYRQISLAHSHLYSFESCGRKYLKVFKKFLNDKR